MDQQTGERLDPTDALYRADLERHAAAYRFAAARIAGEPTRAPCILDLGCGAGYGAAALAAAATGASLRVVAFDRARPAGVSSGSLGAACFVQGDLEPLPFAARSVDVVVSFQVIEHLADPRRYLDELARVLVPGGLALISTPNRLESDGENPFHLREYAPEELERVLAPHFAEVEMLGVFALGAARRYHADRLRQIRRITRLDPLGLRRRLPRHLVDWLFARLSVVVRRLVRRGGAMDRVDPSDFAIRPCDRQSLDCLAVCRGGRQPVGAEAGGARVDHR